MYRYHGCHTISYHSLLWLVRRKTTVVQLVGLIHVRRAVCRPRIRFFPYTHPGVPYFYRQPGLGLKTNLSIRFPAIWLVYTKQKSTSFGRGGASVLWLFHGSHIVTGHPPPHPPTSVGRAKMTAPFKDNIRLFISVLQITNLVSNVISILTLA